MKKIKFDNLQEPSISEEILALLQDNAEEAIEETKGEVLLEASSYITSNTTIEESFEDFRRIDIVHGNWEKEGEKVTTIDNPNGKKVTLETKYATGDLDIRTGINIITLNNNLITFNKNLFYDIGGYKQDVAVSGIWKIIGYR